MLAFAGAGRIIDMIDKISVTNFKSHAHTEIELGRLTVLVGPNGSGKSSFLLAIETLNHIARQIADGGDWDSIERFTRSGTKSVRLTAGGKHPRWKVEVSLNDSPKFEFGNRIWKPGQKPIMTFDDDDNNQIPIRIDQKVVQTFGQVVYFKAVAQSISSPSHTLDIPPHVAQDGGGLASTIAYLMTYLPEQYRLIEEDLKTIVPLIERVRVQPARITVKEKRTISSDGNLLVYDEDRQVIGHELIFDTKSGGGLPASMMSEGTLVALAILSIFHTSSNANLIMFDDIEQALHPLAQRCLVQTLKQLAEKQNKQILFTTHSPYIERVA